MKNFRKSKFTVLTAFGSESIVDRVESLAETDGDYEAIMTMEATPATADLLTFSDTARLLGVGRQTVSDLVRALGVPTYRHPLNGSAKCLEPTGFQQVKRAITAKPPTQSA